MKQRLKYDAYSTPRNLALAITERLKAIIAPPDLVIEPSAGVGPFIEAAAKTWPGVEIHAVDYDKRVERKCRAAGANAFYAMDWLEYVVKFGTSFDDVDNALVLGNPPYVLAQEHVEATLALRANITLLLRINFLGGLKRAKTLWSRPGLSYVIPIAPRPSFAFGGSDPVEYGVFVWSAARMRGPATLLPPLIWNNGKHGGTK